MACKCISLSCFYTQYFITFFSLLILINISCCFGGLVSTIGRFIIISTVSWITTKCIRKKLNTQLLTSYKRAVLITGCDSGFGNRLAFKLNEHGFRVYAAVLDPSNSGSQQLTTNARFTQNMKVIKMDVTKDEEVIKTYEEIEKDLKSNGEELWAIVNNAGIATFGPLDWGTLDSYKNIFEVNTFGTVRVTRTFLPLIRKSKGRIVNVVSIAGRMTGPLLPSYSMSKHAVISFSDALRREMHKWGVKVSTIEPGFYKTPIASKENVSKSFINLWNETSDSVKQVYGQQYLDVMKDYNLDSGRMLKMGEDIESVIEKMVDAVRSEEPQIRYVSVEGMCSQLAVLVGQFLPTEWMDQMFYFRDKKMPKPYLLNA